MNNLPIGIFDSGVGGLSCLREISSLLPYENITYLADTKRMPYGEKSPKQLIEFTKNNVDFLQKQNVKIIVAACGTISANVQKFDIDNLSVPFIDIITPTAKKACLSTQNKKVGIIATQATINTNIFAKSIKSIAPYAQTISVACKEFAPLIEKGHIKDDIIKGYIREYLTSIKNFNADTLILGCTHYNIIQSEIQDFMGKNVKIINSGKETALQVQNILQNLNLQNHNKYSPTKNFFVTANTNNFNYIGKFFLNDDSVKSVLVDI